MSNLLTLMKVDLRETLDRRKFKENKANSTSFLTFIILFGLLFIFGSVVYNLSFASMFYISGEPMIYSTLMMAGITSVLAFSTSVFKCKSIFIGSDYEMLSAMPIRKTEIIASKILNLYFLELVYSLIIMVPNTVINIIFTSDFSFILTGLLVAIFVPAVPMLLACLFSLFVTLIADRYKFGNIITFIIYIVLFAMLMGFSFLMNLGSIGGSTGDSYDMSGYLAVVNVFSWMNPTLQLVKLSATVNYSFIALFALTNVLLFIGVCAFIALLFDKVREAINTFKSDIVYEAKELESVGSFKNLFRFEFKRYFGTKYYFINSISSGIVAVLIAGMLAVMFSPYTSFIPDPDTKQVITNYAYIGSLAIMWGIGIQTPSSCSISIEGNKFWMLKTFPINYRDLCKSKMLLSIVVLAPFAVISSILLCALVQASWVHYIATIIISVLYVALASILSLGINLRHYKLKWKNEQECVKSSAGAVLSMLADWGVMLVCGSTLLGLAFVNMYVSMGVTVAVLLLGIFIFYNIIMSTCENKISKIEEF